MPCEVLGACDPCRPLRRRCLVVIGHHVCTSIAHCLLSVQETAACWLGLLYTLHTTGRVRPAEMLYEAVLEILRREALDACPLYIAGESFGGRYIPALVGRLLQDAPLRLLRLKVWSWRERVRHEMVPGDTTIGVPSANGHYTRPPS